MIPAKVTVNGKAPDVPQFFSTSTQVNYIFLATTPGEYTIRTETALPFPGWPTKVWHVLVANE